MKTFQLSEKLLNRIADLIQAKKDTQLKKLVKDIHYADMAEIIKELNQDKQYDFCFVGHFESFGREESLRPFMDKNSYIQHSEVGRQKKKYDFDFELLSDPDEIACNLFDVIKMKNMYGKQVRGIERSTFVIDEDGQIIKEWRGVKVNGHVDEVLEFLSS